MSQEGYIYILANASMSGQLKIGKTTRQPEQRAKEFEGTNMPTPFLVVHKRFVRSLGLVEKNIHAKLSPYRINPRREFFELDVVTAINIVDGVCNEYSLEVALPDASEHFYHEEESNNLELAEGFKVANANVIFRRHSRYTSFDISLQIAFDLYCNFVPSDLLVIPLDRVEMHFRCFGVEIVRHMRLGAPSYFLPAGDIWVSIDGMLLINGIGTLKHTFNTSTDADLDFSQNHANSLLIKIAPLNTSSFFTCEQDMMVEVHE